MEFNFVDMTEEHIRSIATWKYEGIYAFYDWDDEPGKFYEGSKTVHAVLDDEGSLVGYFGFTSEASTVEIGLGLRPDHTGRGLGHDFVLAGLQFAREEYAPTTFRLEVASFNKRAIRVYEHAGFQCGRSYRSKAGTEDVEFVAMSRPA